MVNNLELAKDNIKDLKKYFYIKKKNKIDDNAIKSLRILFKLKIKMRQLKMEQEDDYYKPIRVCNFWNNYI